MSDTSQLPTAHVASPPSAPAPHGTRTNDLLLSALVPGLGQLAQRRWVPALVQGATVATYLGGAFLAGGEHAYWLALGWNAWSAIDAYWHGRD